MSPLSDFKSIVANAVEALNISQSDFNNQQATLTTSKWLSQKLQLVECEQTIAQLNVILKQYNTPSPELTAKLIELLKLRDETITRTSIGYTAKPSSIANQLCLNIAQWILKQANPDGPLRNRDLYKILMPSLQITGVFSPIMNAYTDIDDFPAYGTFLLSDDLLNGESGEIISYKDIVELTAEPYLYAYTMHSPTKAAAIPLTVKSRQLLAQIQLNSHNSLSSTEKNRLREFTLGGKTLFTNMDQRVEGNIKTRTPREMLTILINGLRDGGSHRAGRDALAASPANEAIAIFFEYWNSLSNNLRAELENCRDSGSRRLGDALRERLMVSGSFRPCVESTANQLDGFLTNSNNRTLLNITPYIQGRDKRMPPGYEQAKNIEAGEDELKHAPIVCLEQVILSLRSLSRCTSLFDVIGRNALLVKRFCELFAEVPKEEQSKVCFNRFYELSEPDRDYLLDKLIENETFPAMQTDNLAKILKLFTNNDSIGKIAEQIDRQEVFLMIGDVQSIVKTLSGEGRLVFIRQLEKTIIRLIQSSGNFIAMIRDFTAAETMAVITALKGSEKFGQIIRLDKATIKTFEKQNSREKVQRVFDAIVDSLMETDEIQTLKDIVTLAYYVSDERCEDVYTQLSDKLKSAIQCRGHLIELMLPLTVAKTSAVMKVIDHVVPNDLYHPDGFNDFVKVFSMMPSAVFVEIYKRDLVQFLSLMVQTNPNAAWIFRIVSIRLPDYASRAELCGKVNFSIFSSIQDSFDFEHMLEAIPQPHRIKYIDALKDRLLSFVSNTNALMKLITELGRPFAEHLFEYIPLAHTVKLIRSENDLNKIGAALKPDDAKALNDAFLERLTDRMNVISDILPSASPGANINEAKALALLPYELNSREMAQAIYQASRPKGLLNFARNALYPSTPSFERVNEALQRSTQVQHAKRISFPP